jgi:hypothetical protein
MILIFYICVGSTLINDFHTYLAPFKFSMQHFDLGLFLLMLQMRIVGLKIWLAFAGLYSCLASGPEMNLFQFCTCTK